MENEKQILDSAVSEKEIVKDKSKYGISLDMGTRFAELDKIIFE